MREFWFAEFKPIVPQAGIYTLRTKKKTKGPFNPFGVLTKLNFVILGQQIVKVPNVLHRISVNPSFRTV